MSFGFWGKKYFKRHDSNNRKLSTREWVITNEVCSLLDVVAEVATRIQGAEDTHISLTIFNILEIKDTRPKLQ